jgi:hypothetical protein
MARITVEQKHSMRRDVCKYKGFQKENSVKHKLLSGVRLKASDFKAKYSPTQAIIIRDEKDGN